MTTGTQAIELVISPVGVGWRIAERSGRIPESVYDDLEQAREDALEYLRHHGGGTLTVREGGRGVSSEDVVPRELGRLPRG